MQVLLMLLPFYRGPTLEPVMKRSKRQDEALRRMRDARTLAILAARDFGAACIRTGNAIEEFGRICQDHDLDIIEAYQHSNNPDFPPSDEDSPA